MEEEEEGKGGSVCEKGKNERKGTKDGWMDEAIIKVMTMGSKEELEAKRKRRRWKGLRERGKGKEKVHFFSLPWRLRRSGVAQRMAYGVPTHPSLPVWCPIIT